MYKMPSRLLILFLLFVSVQISIGQGRMSASELKKCVDPVRLTTHLIDGAENDMEKLEVIFQWIIDHIQYDKKALTQDSQRINQGLEDVLKRKKALCVGYARLLVEMCTQAGIRAVEVSGYVRSIDNANTFDVPDHSWNAVFIEGKWQLLDPTWAAGLKEKTNALMQKYDVNYFLTDPGIFILNHVPSLPIWQLLVCPLPLEMFYMSTDKLESYLEYNQECEVEKQREKYLALSKKDQTYEANKASYLFNPGPYNRKIYASSVLDRALGLKEKGDDHFYNGEYDEASAVYSSALGDISTEIMDGFALQDWQREGIALIYFHRGQITYNSITSKQDPEYEQKMARVLDDLRAAKWYAKYIKPTILNQGFLDQLGQTLRMVEEQME